MRHVLTALLISFWLTLNGEEPPRDNAKPGILRLESCINGLSTFTVAERAALARDVARTIRDLAVLHPAPSEPAIRAVVADLASFLESTERQRQELPGIGADAALDFMRAEAELMLTIAYSRKEMADEEAGKVKGKLLALGKRVDGTIDRRIAEQQRSALHEYMGKAFAVAIAQFEKSVNEPASIDGYYLGLRNLDGLLLAPEDGELNIFASIDYSDPQRARSAMQNALNRALMDIAQSPFFSAPDGAIIEALDKQSVSKTTLFNESVIRADDKRNNFAPKP